MIRAATAALLAVAALAGAGAAPGAAAVAVSRDAQGRAIRIDVRASGTSAGEYARILRTAIHGDEISGVTVVVVAGARIAQACGSDHAGGCYGDRRGRATITIPAGPVGEVAPVLLHEYGHHVDRSRPNGDLREPNGTPRWWAARAMGARLREGQVAYDYRLGWSRSIGEIFAEDYAQLHIRTAYRIPWLPPRSTSVLRALRLDLTGRAAGPAPALPPPVVITRAGTLAPGRALTLPFGLLGPGRRVTLVVRLTGDPGAAARAEVACDGAVRAARDVAGGEEVGLETGPLGPATCAAALTARTGRPGYRVELTLTRDREAAAPPRPRAGAAGPGRPRPGRR